MQKIILKTMIALIVFSTLSLAQLTQTDVSKLYVSIFNRASEGSGNSFWQKASSSMEEAAKNMLETPDAKDYFGDSLNSNRAFVEHIYKNTLNKTTSDDPDGIDFWTNSLNNGTSRSKMISDFINAIGTFSNTTDPKAKSAYNRFMNRVAVSNYMANHVNKTPEDYKTSTSFSADLRMVNDNPDSVDLAKDSIKSMATENEDTDEKSINQGLGALVPTTSMLDTIPQAIPVSSYILSDLPSSFDFSDQMPPVRSQGQQGSCASWAVGYYLKSYHEHLEKETVYGEAEVNDFSGAYSPAFLYNRLKIGSCDGGSYIHENLEMVRDVGIASWNDMPYTDKSCDAFPSTKATKNAKCSKILNYQTVRIHEPIEDREIQDMKYYLSNYNPLVIGIYIHEGFLNHTQIGGESFYKHYKGKKYYGGHAIVVVGYDDSKNAFKIINSWGKDWGNDGFLWIDYEVFKKIVFVVYRTEDAKNECEDSSSYLFVNQQSILFKEQLIDKTYTKSFILSNTGSVAFAIDNITVPDGYSLNWTNGTLNAGDKQTVEVTFSPTEQKSYNGKITIEHNADGGDSEIEISGSGVNKLNHNQAPIANAGADITIPLGGEISLDASKSSDADGNIINYQWRYNGGYGRSSTSPIMYPFTPRKLFVGTHIFTLTVTDNTGQTDTDTLTVTVTPREENLAPIADMSLYDYDKDGNSRYMYIAITQQDSKIKFYSFSSFDYDGEIVSYEWKDGNTILSREENFEKDDFSIGEHNVTLTVKDDDGAIGRDSVIVTIGRKNNIAPIANAGGNHTIKLGEDLIVDASKSSDSDGEIVEYHWTHIFDGNSIGGLITTFPTTNLGYDIKSIGVHTFTLRVRDSDGSTDTDTMTVTVLEN